MIEQSLIDTIYQYSIHIIHKYVIQVIFQLDFAWSLFRLRFNQNPMTMTCPFCQAHITTGKEMDQLQELMHVKRASP